MTTQMEELSKKKEKTELILSNVINLPVIPKIMTEAMKMLDNKLTNATELSKLISKDQALVTRILTIANSPLYGLQRKVTTIDFALLILGYRELRNIITALSIIEAFKNKTDKYLDQKEFLLHSFLTGTASKKLAEELGYTNSGEAFICGFLHDVGLSVLHRYMHSSFASICDMVEKDGVTYHEAELEVLGTTHENIGFFLLEKWNFPVELTNAVLYHHEPVESAPGFQLTNIVNLADYMTKYLNIGAFKWDKDIKLCESTIKQFNFNSPEEIDNFINGYKDLFWSQLDFIRFLN